MKHFNSASMNTFDKKPSMLQFYDKIKWEKMGKSKKFLENGFQGEMVLWQFSDVMIDA